MSRGIIENTESHLRHTARAARIHCSHRPFEMLMVPPLVAVDRENLALPDCPTVLVGAPRHLVTLPAIPPSQIWSCATFSSWKTMFLCVHVSVQGWATARGPKKKRNVRIGVNALGVAGGGRVYTLRGTHLQDLEVLRTNTGPGGDGRGSGQAGQHEDQAGRELHRDGAEETGGWAGRNEQTSSLRGFEPAKRESVLPSGTG